MRHGASIDAAPRGRPACAGLREDPSMIAGVVNAFTRIAFFTIWRLVLG
jgi:hypothetical protein